MNRQMLRVAWYRFRATFGRRRGRYLTLVLLVGLVGGLAMGALSAARRTDSSFATYLASTDPSNLTVTVIGGAQVGGGSANYSSGAAAEVARLPGVKHVESAVPLVVAPLLADGAPRLNADTASSVFPVASVTGEFFDQDRVAVTQGRMADPDRADEVMMTATAANLLGYHVGEVIPVGIYSQEQETLPGFGTPSVPPLRRIDAHLVGIVQVSNAVVQDDIDRFPTFIFFTPAMGKAVIGDGGQGTDDIIYYGLQLDRGNGGVGAVEREFATVAPPGTNLAFHAIAPVEAKVDRTVKPVAIALGVFGAVAALAALLIGLQVISRQIRDAGEESSVLRALGGGPTVIAADSLVGILGAVVAGSLLAGGVCVALSPLSPLGPVRPVYPHLGIAFDWTVLGIGIAVLIVGLGSMAIALAYRGAPHRDAGRSRLASPRTSRAMEAFGSAGLPAPAVIGVRLALEPGRGPTAVPVRSALLGSVLAVAMVAATLTFGSGLQSLVSHPALYGWDWSYMLDASNNVPPQAISLLNHDPDVATWTGYNYNVQEINGQYFPFLYEANHPAGRVAIVPPILTGHQVDDKNQIVLGAATMAQLHKHIGDTVEVSNGAPEDGPAVYMPPTPAVIVGTATLPAVGFSSVVDDHTSMGTGALVSDAIVPTAWTQGTLSPYPTLNGQAGLVLVRLRSGVPASAGLARLQHIAAVANQAFEAVPNGAGQGNSVSVVGVQRPAEIVNYRTIGDTPALLASALAVGAIVALGLTLTASVRRRRRDLALLKTLGFTQRQLAATVACQSSVAAVIGIVVGLPLGIAVGRWLWTLFARQIYAVPHPTVPVLAVLLVAVGALVFANVVAALPGLSAARTSTATLLRAE